MRAIVIGAGKVGYHIARQLSGENNDVVVIDNREEALAPTRESLDVMTVLGNGASPAVLEEANVADTDMVIAVTTQDEVNIIACLTAKHYGVTTTVARVRNADYMLSARAFIHGQAGIDLIINPERLAALEIVKLLKTPTASEVGTYAGGRVQLLGLRCDEHDQAILNKPLWRLGLRNILVVALVRGDAMLIPDGNTQIESGDYIYVLGRTGDLERSAFIAGRSHGQIQTVTIVGGGEIGLRICEILSGFKGQGLTIKLVEKDRERAAFLAEILPDVLVLHGDGTQIEFLESEQVGDSDALVAVSGHEETNLLIAMLGKRLGAKEIIVELGRQEYWALADTIGVRAVVVPRLLTASTILRLLRKDRLLDVSFLKQGQAEVMEVVISGDAPIAGKTLRVARMPKNSLVGTIIRGNEVIIPHGGSEIRANDRVVVFSQVESVPRVNEMLGM
ncbi:MAG: Trk system potassium transporter TrkA [Bacillota bacterium]|jgi:trk system potassium uptake protein TrkA